MFSQAGHSKQPGASIHQNSVGTVSPTEASDRFLELAQMAFHEGFNGRANANVAKAVQVFDTHEIRNNFLRTRVREQAALLLIAHDEGVDAERYLSEAIQIKATIVGVPNKDLDTLRTIKAEILVKLGRFEEAHSLWCQVADSVAKYGADSVLEKRVILGQANLASRRSDNAMHGHFMAKLFNTISLVPKESQSELGEMLVEASSAEELEGRFEIAKPLVAAALDAIKASGEYDQEAITLLTLQVAEMAYKTGDFAEALKLRTMILSEVVSNHGASSKLALQIKLSIAEIYVERSEFEKAEHLLTESIECCGLNGYDIEAVQAANMLISLYSARNMEGEASDILLSISVNTTNLPTGYSLIMQAETSAVEKLLTGNHTGACEDLKALLSRAERINGVERYYVEASILASLGWTYLHHDLNEAKEYIKLAHEVIFQLPNKCAQTVLIKVRDVEEQIASLEGNYKDASAIIHDQLEQVGKIDGAAGFNMRSLLLQRLASSQNLAKEFGDAQQTARNLKQLLESHSDTNSLRYAQALLMLAHLLPESDSEFNALMEQAGQIVKRHYPDLQGFD